MTKIGRPPEPVPQDIADALCVWLSEGKTLAAFCRKKGSPDRSTIYDWLDKDEEFARRYARARSIGYDAIADVLVTIADDGTNDSYVDENGNQRTDHDVLGRSKLRIEARQWLLARWDPKRFGSKPEDRERGPSVEPDARYD